MQELTEVYLGMDGFEALRLVDIEGLKHEEAAGKMGVSRQTFGRILAGARRTVTEALFYGMALRLDGGNFQIKDHPDREGLAVSSAPCVIDTPTPVVKQYQKELDMDKMDKIAVTSDGPNLDGPLDSAIRPGRRLHHHRSGNRGIHLPRQWRFPGHEPGGRHPGSRKRQRVPVPKRS